MQLRAIRETVLCALWFARAYSLPSAYFRLEVG